jgi:hypothetical protein
MLFPAFFVASEMISVVGVFLWRAAIEETKKEAAKNRISNQNQFYTRCLDGEEILQTYGTRLDELMNLERIVESGSLHVLSEGHFAKRS